MTDKNVVLHKSLIQLTQCPGDCANNLRGARANIRDSNRDPDGLRQP